MPQSNTHCQLLTAVYWKLLHESDPAVVQISATLIEEEEGDSERKKHLEERAEEF